MIRRRNALEPRAYYDEGHPFIIRGRKTVDEHHEGVHTATDYIRAVLYAVQRAMPSVTPEQDEPNCGIVLHLDVSGLTPLPDRDAMIAAEQQSPRDLLEIEGVREAYEHRDTDALVEALENDLEFGDSYYQSDAPPTEWTEGAIQQLDYENANVITRTVADLQDDELLAAFDMLVKRDDLPAHVWMVVSGQQRYMEPIGFDRLVQVDAIRPIRFELWGHGSDDPDDAHYEEYPEDDPDSPEVFSDQQFYEGDHMPQTVTLWKRPKPRGAHIEYHGTDVFRARQAFPEVAAKIRCPWPYGQPDSEDTSGPLAMFAVPQSIIEAASDKPGVGVFPIARNTGRFLLGLRSWRVESPNQWSGFGGAKNYAETPEDAAMRELYEETGFDGEAELVEIAPDIFLAYVDVEYAPKINWETEDVDWFDVEEARALEPKYWGLEVVLRELR